jgi:peptide/nickel transport system permease protein
MATISEALAVQPGVLTPVSTRRRIRGGMTIGVVLSGAFVVFLVIAAAWPSLLANGSPLTINLGDAFQAPSLHHLFGTDESGRDVFTRVLYGARQSLSIGVGATALGLAGGAVLGVLAGLGGRWVDGAINRFLEVMFAFPGLLLALVVVAMFGPGATTEIAAVAVGSAPGYARMIRGQVLSVKGSGYVEAAYALGHTRRRVIGRTILPNAMRPLVVLGTLGIGQSIVWASSLSFLGLGVAPPAPEWGAMLDAGRDLVTQAWWLEIFPGLAIVACALSVTTIGRYLRQRFEGETG